MTPSEQERIKLTASFLNALASGTILAAIVAPYIGWGWEQCSLPAGSRMSSACRHWAS
jgi:hypothetical protein